MLLDFHTDGLSSRYRRFVVASDCKQVIADIARSKKKEKKG
jgi:hypothetical protein